MKRYFGVRAAFFKPLVITFISKHFGAKEDISDIEEL